MELSFFFFSQSQNGLLLGIGGSAAALWDSFVCPVFTDGLVYGYPDEVGSLLSFFSSSMFCFYSDLGHVGELHGLASSGS